MFWSALFFSVYPSICLLAVTEISLKMRITLFRFWLWKLNDNKNSIIKFSYHSHFGEHSNRLSHGAVKWQCSLTSPLLMTSEISCQTTQSKLII